MLVASGLIFPAIPPSPRRGYSKAVLGTVAKCADIPLGAQAMHLQTNAETYINVRRTSKRASNTVDMRFAIAPYYKRIGNPLRAKYLFVCLTLYVP